MTAHLKSGAIGTTHPSSPESRRGRAGWRTGRARRLWVGLVAVAALALTAAVACGGDGTVAPTAGVQNTQEAQDAQDRAEEFAAIFGDATEGEPDGAEVVESDNPNNLAALNRQGDELYRPDFKDPSGFINSEPFTLDDLDGQVILVDFWTYTCINCIRTMPFLKDWYAKYADDGLVIVGVHSPEFDFEKIRANVEQAVAEFGLEYPIVQDNDFGTWRNYQNRFWPAKYLIDRDGYIRYTHFGEGAYEETELMIRELLAENGGSVAVENPEFLTAPDLDSAALSANDTRTSATRELYAGTARNYGIARFGGQPPYVRHEQYFARQETPLEYKDPGDHENHFLYLNGLWRNGPESLTHAQTTEAYEDWVAIKFYGTSANIVLGVPESGESYEVRVTLDGAPFPSDHAGADVMWDEDGNSYLLVDEERLYMVARTPAFGGFELKLSSNSDDFEFFAFSFGVFKNVP